MNPTDPTPLDTLLDDSIEAAREVDDYALADAARRFRNRLPQARPRRSPVASWFRVAGVAALLVLAVGLAPLLLPGKPGASAFAEARAWFEQYETLQFEMKTSRDGQVLSTVRVWSDESGATRIETPPITHLVLPAENVMHTLLPGGEVMSQRLGPLPGAFNLGDGMEWLDELVTFQGLAEPVDDSRTVDGIEALGWRLELANTMHTLWVDPADNRPLLLEAELGGGVRMTSMFTFDKALPASLFELPAQR